MKELQWLDEDVGLRLGGGRWMAGAEMRTRGCVWTAGAERVRKRGRRDAFKRRGLGGGCANEDAGTRSGGGV